MKIVIVDYGMGNIRSIVGALKYIGVKEILVSSNYDEIRNSDKLILPGVGSFGKAMDQIRIKNIDTYLKEVVIQEKKPILGICLGMQLLGMSSTEDGDNEGLKFVNGEVKKFEDRGFKVPHVGLNQVKISENGNLYSNLPALADFYFTHSYKMESSSNINQSICTYGCDFIASFEFENIAGVQFHPELSQGNGLKLLKNYIGKF
jgi:glutamine amidotransferase